MASLAVGGTALVILGAIDNATAEQINCVEVVRTDTGEDQVSCQETGWPRLASDWITRA
jgi:hypothetical protein